eukprot:NODE_1095_length_1708_cov_33.107896_g971_i0.p1 GENE.NODE_1095_length_1708_cov_33.107896_g971_i0~~NODE_1095_length_1708_cov_33.107896_g971_i0.p1  ORF type:complete len:500 (+),score=62.74 NODE_1095_length_1708_cov_33.107896_g971_i0:97-1596(+)
MYGSSNAPLPSTPGEADPLSIKIIYFVAAAMVLDFTVSLMSIQALWYLLGGSQAWYGFAFGCYDLTQLIFAPMLGVWADARNVKEVLLVTLAINVAGNALYGMSFYLDHAIYIVIARLISGAGSANISVAFTYLTRGTALSDRSEIVGSFRAIQGIARFLGPQLGFLLIYLPQPTTNGADSWLTYLNFYTSGGWVAVVVSSIAFFAVLLRFQDINVGPESSPIPLGSVNSIKESQESPSPWAVAFKHFGWLYALQFVVTFGMWCLMSNLFAIAEGQYCLAMSQDDMWRLWIAVGIAAFVGIFSFKKLIAKGIDEFQLASAGVVIIVLGGFAMTSYFKPGKPEHCADATTSSFLRYFIATGLIGFGNQFYYPCISIFFSKKISLFGRQNPNFMKHIGFITGLFTMIGSAGRFAGPFMSSHFMQITNLTQDPDSNCHLDTERYYLDSCGFKGDEFLATVSTLLAVLFVGIIAMRSFGWIDSQGPEAASPLLGSKPTDGIDA